MSHQVTRKSEGGEAKKRSGWATKSRECWRWGRQVAIPPQCQPQALAPAVRGITYTLGCRPNFRMSRGFKIPSLTSPLWWSLGTTPCLLCVATEVRAGDRDLWKDPCHPKVVKTNQEKSWKRKRKKRKKKERSAAPNVSCGMVRSAEGLAYEACAGPPNS